MYVIFLFGYIYPKNTVDKWQMIATDNCELFIECEKNDDWKMSFRTIDLAFVATGCGTRTRKIAGREESTRER